MLAESEETATECACWVSRTVVRVHVDMHHLFSVIVCSTCKLSMLFKVACCHHTIWQRQEQQLRGCSGVRAAKLAAEHFHKEGKMPLLCSRRDLQLTCAAA
eukprot:1140381-Pelagomonas_calceolata.AAC.9